MKSGNWESASAGAFGALIPLLNPPGFYCKPLERDLWDCSQIDTPSPRVPLSPVFCLVYSDLDLTPGQKQGAFCQREVPDSWYACKEQGNTNMQVFMFSVHVSLFLSAMFWQRVIPTLWSSLIVASPFPWWNSSLQKSFPNNRYN